MWTTGAAKVIGWSDVGSLSPGNQADVLIVDRDPMRCDIDDLADTKVLRTMLGGRTVYDSGDLSAPSDESTAVTP